LSDHGFKVKKIYDISSIDSLQVFAREVAARLKPGLTIGLRGDLGAGKTTFVAEVARALGINEAVTSPSFVLQHEYQTTNLKIEHWDLYRLNFIPEELIEPASPDAVRFIEWFDKFDEVKEQCLLQLSFRLIFVDDADGILRREVILEDFTSE
jgi:tRNA threonylcarbamoyladenosine biosynthesis protein TsaE